MIQIGRLRQRITLQFSTPVQDPNGEPIDVWANLASVPTVWANIRVKPSVGGERFVPGASVVQAEVIHTVTIRFRADITPKMRALIGARVLLIENVYDPTGEREYTILECREVQ